MREIIDVIVFFLALFTSGMTGYAFASLRRLKVVRRELKKIDLAGIDALARMEVLREMNYFL